MKIIFQFICPLFNGVAISTSAIHGEYLIMSFCILSFIGYIGCIIYDLIQAKKELSDTIIK